MVTVTLYNLKSFILILLHCILQMGCNYWPQQQIYHLILWSNFTKKIVVMQEDNVQRNMRSSHTNMGLTLLSETQPRWNCELSTTFVDKRPKCKKQRGISYSEILQVEPCWNIRSFQSTKDDSSGIERIPFALRTTYASQVAQVLAA